MTNSLKLSYHYRGPPRCFRERGNKSIYSRGTGEQMQNFEGNRGTKAILGKRERNTTNFRFWGTREQANFISGEQRNR